METITKEKQLDDLKVLFVDDSLTMRRILKNILKNIGINQLIEAEHGAEAMLLLEDHDIDIVLTDWNMPVMNGEDFIKMVRKIPRFQQIPFLMITTRGMREDVIKAISLGIDGYISKPFTAQILKDKISKLVFSDS
jgi:two-component system chemotaxis response regulator CheY